MSHRSNSAIIEVDFWENQRYNPITGWSIGRAPAFSDITCKIPFNYDRIKTGSIQLFHGWEWCSADWSIDVSSLYGETDNEGWSYSTSFELLIEQSLLKQLINESNKLNIVRRRRWIRSCRCYDSTEKINYQQKVEWMEHVRQQITLIQKQQHEQYYKKIICHHEKQSSAMNEMLLIIDIKLQSIMKSLQQLIQNLIHMKEFLYNLGIVEKNYSKLLINMNKKWKQSLKKVKIIKDETSSQQQQQQQQQMQQEAEGVKSNASNAVRDDGIAVNYITTWSDTVKNTVSNTVRGLPQRSRSFFSSTTFYNKTQQQQQQQQGEGSGHGTAGDNNSDNGAAISQDIINFSDADDDNEEEEEVIASEEIKLLSSNDSTTTTTTGIAFDSTTDTVEDSLSNQKHFLKQSSFINSVTEANQSIAQRVNDFSNLLTLSLPLGIDNLLSEIEEIIKECKEHGNQLRININNKIKLAEKRYDIFIKCHDNSQIDLIFQNEYLCDHAYRISATSLQQHETKGPNTSNSQQSTFLSSSISWITSTATATSTINGIEVSSNKSNITMLQQKQLLTRSDSFTAFLGVEHVDVWLAIQLYSSIIFQIESLLKEYEKFQKNELLKLKRIMKSFEILMQSIMEQYTNERFRLWTDSASMLYSATINTINQIQKQTIDSDDIQKQGTSRSAASKLFHTTSSEEILDEDIEVSSPQAEFINNIFTRFHADFSSSGFQNNIFVAYHGPLSYCTVNSNNMNSNGSTDLSSRSGGDHHAAGASGTGREELAEHSLWEDAYVLVTFNRVIHILKPPRPDEDSLAFSEDRLLLSINARDATIGHVDIPKEGYRDAFEVIPSDDRKRTITLDNIMMNAASTVGVSASKMIQWAVKDVASVVFIADNALLMRNWMRAITNPFADPNTDPPYPDAVAMNGNDGEILSAEANMDQAVRGMQQLGSEPIAGSTALAARTRASFIASDKNTIGSGRADDELVVEGANPMQRAALMRNKSRSKSVTLVSQNDLVVSGENPLR